MLLQTVNHHNAKAILEKKNKSLYLSNSQSFVIGAFERGKKKSISFFLFRELEKKFRRENFKFLFIYLFSFKNRLEEPRFKISKERLCCFV